MTGTGTIADPFIITTAADLQAIEDDLDAYYELGGNVDASGTSSWNANAGFDPITGFSGSLDGKGYTVTDLFIDRATESVGLFHTSSGSISNLGLVTCNFTGLGAAAFVGYTNTGTITECSATGAITANSVGAGFVAINQSTITNCYTRCSVTGDGSGFLAGFAWDNDGGICDDCYSTGAVSNATFEEGFAFDGGGTVTNCFWDTQTSGQATSEEGTGKTTAEMKYRPTFTQAGWDFTKVWSIATAVNNGYPALGTITSIGRRYVWIGEDGAWHWFTPWGIEVKVDGSSVTGDLGIMDWM